MKKYVLVALLPSTLVVGSALYAFEQTETFIVELADFGQYSFFDENAMANAPPAHENDKIALIFALDERQGNVDARELTREPLTVDTVLLVNWESPPNYGAILASIDMETSALLSRCCNYSENFGTRIGNRLNDDALLTSTPSLRKEVQAEAESIVLVATSTSPYIGQNAESDVLGYPSGYV
ncbi:hypothetical protein GW764_00560 [Candidatus Parcubacteria bacterium]|nr:hypothetical protein [Candidatus Parcubacteria bacterium]